MTLLSRRHNPSLAGRGLAGQGVGDGGRSLVVKENESSLFIAMFAVLLHAVAFFCTVIMSAEDVLIAVKDGFGSSSSSSVSSKGSNSAVGANVSGWAAAALSSSAFKRGLDSWHALDTTRLICAIVGWACACLLVWRDLQAREGRGQEIVRLRDLLWAWKRRASELEGAAGLDHLDAQGLRRLVALQSMGYERAVSALRVYSEMDKAAS